jgi:hypothetical protein
MSTKMLFILPFAVAALAGCAASSDTSRQSQVNAACANLSGAAYLECQKKAEPASRSVNDDFKMVKPKPGRGNLGSVGS